MLCASVSNNYKALFLILIDQTEISKIRYNRGVKSSHKNNILSGAKCENFKGIIHDLTIILLRG